MSTAITQRESNVTNALQLESINNQLVGLLQNNPKKMEAFKTRMLKMSTSKMLMQCSPESVIAAGLQALTMGLPLEAGQGYVVKYGKGKDAQAQLDIGYKGWQVLAKRSGYSVMADAVYSCDLFEQGGYGFNAQLSLEPNHAERRTANDKWVKENITGVIVSIREDENDLQTSKWVPADLIFKIIAGSPSKDSDYSPHNKWAEQMMCAKAIKQVLSKAPIDLSKAEALHDAIQIVNNTESHAQAEQNGLPEYTQARFDTNWPKWVELVETGKQKAVTIITQLCNGFALSEHQMQKVMTLSNHEVIEGDVVDDPETTTESEPEQQQETTAEAEPETKLQYTEADFKKIYPVWRKSVEKGDTTPDALIENIAKTHELNETQLQSVQGLHDCAPIAQEA